MGNQYYQLILRNGFDNIHYFEGISAVQISGRFICDYNCRVFYYSSGYTYPLSFTTRKHVGISVPIPVHTYFLKNIVDFFLYLFLIPDTYHFQCNCHIVKHGHIVYKIVILKNIPYIEIPYAVYFPCSSSCDFLAVDIHPAFIDLIQSSYHIKQCGLTASAWSQQCHKSLVLQFQRGVVNNMDLILFSSVEIFVYFLKPDHDQSSSLKLPRAVFLNRLLANLPEISSAITIRTIYRTT